MRRGLLAIAFLMGCGGPVLRNAPRPNPVHVAAGAAAIAGAATLADPDAAKRRQEQKRESDVGKRPQNVDNDVPSDVLDRLDEADAQRKREEAERGAAADPD
jgi:hypothetical protein